ncbi:MAG: membrane protein FxsA [Roseibacillus sp.]|nr:membrane protein FxsA [Roseibacillus sp.]|tara:strand:- start:9688 stop:10122 length:435 start_codon:yes stop_codon:yes gene_type:complete
MFLKLLSIFILVPILELSLLLRVGSKIGLEATLAIILLTAFIGAILTRTQGSRALSNFRNALADGKLPHREALDGLLILLAGAVLLTPGFLTDAAGFLLLFAPTRAAIRERLSTYLQKRIQIISPGPQQSGPGKQSNDGDFIDV